MRDVQPAAPVKNLIQISKDKMENINLKLKEEQKLDLRVIPSVTVFVAPLLLRLSNAFGKKRRKVEMEELFEERAASLVSCV